MNIATHFFRRGLVNYDGDFTTTDLFKYLSDYYGEMVYSSSDSLFLGVYQSELDGTVWYVEKIFYDVAKEHPDLKMKELGCWIPKGLSHLLGKKKFYADTKLGAFQLSNVKFTTVKVEKKDWDFLIDSSERTPQHNKLLIKYAPTSSIITKLNKFSDDPFRGEVIGMAFNQEIRLGIRNVGPVPNYTEVICPVEGQVTFINLVDPRYFIEANMLRAGFTP